MRESAAVRARMGRESIWWQPRADNSKERTWPTNSMSRPLTSAQIASEAKTSAGLFIGRVTGHSSSRRENVVQLHQWAIQRAKIGLSSKLLSASVAPPPATSGHGPGAKKGALAAAVLEEEAMGDFFRKECAAFALDADGKCLCGRARTDHEGGSGYDIIVEEDEFATTLDFTAKNPAANSDGLSVISVATNAFGEIVDHARLPNSKITTKYAVANANAY